MAVACGLTRAQRGYVGDGLRPSYAVTFVDGFDQLESQLASLVRCEVMVLGPQDAFGRSAAPIIERVVREWPETGVVVFYPSGAADAPPAMSIVRAGAHELVYEGLHPTAGKLAIAVESARRFVAGTAVYETLEPLVPAAVKSMVEAVLARPDQVTEVEQLAAVLGVHRKTLFNRCARARFVPPAELVMWCRLAMVARLLDRSGATVEAIALTVGYPSHTALRNTVKRYLGCTATQARARGALGLVRSALEARVGAAPPAAELHVE